MRKMLLVVAFVLTQNGCLAIRAAYWELDNDDTDTADTGVFDTDTDTNNF